MGSGTMATAVTDSHPITIPNILRLELSSANWAIFTLCFQEVMQANQKWGHFDGSSTCLIPADANKPTNDEKAAMADWDHEESIVLYMLSQHLLDSTAVCLQNVTSV